VGVPASASSAGSGYITPDALATIIDSVASQPNFGGVMMWDANRAFANVDANGVNYAQNAKNALIAAEGGSSSGHESSESSKSAAANTGTAVIAVTKSLTTQSPVPVPTTLKTVRQKTSVSGGTGAAVGVDKGRVATYSTTPSPS
jgi:chitinase